MASIFKGSGLDFRRCFDDISNFLAYFWLLLQGVPDKVFSQLAKKIRMIAEDKAENKIRTDAYEKNQTPKRSSSKICFLSQPSRLQKLWAAVLPSWGLQLNERDAVFVGT